MKLRMIAESSARLLEAWERAKADTVSREQAAKTLVVTALRKVRNLLGPMGLLKARSKNEPIPELHSEFNSLRNIVQRMAEQDARAIQSETDEKHLDHISKYWGFKIPKNWHDINSSQATADGLIDGWFRDAQKKMVGVSPGGDIEFKQKARILKSLGDEIWRWHQRL